jgi:hypothetical protein
LRESPAGLEQLGFLFVLRPKLDHDCFIGKPELDLSVSSDRLPQIFARGVPRLLEGLGQDDASPDVDDSLRVSLTISEGLPVPRESRSPAVTELVGGSDPYELRVARPWKPLTGLAKEILFDASLEGHVGDDQRTPTAAMRNIAWRFPSAPRSFDDPRQLPARSAALRQRPLDLDVFVRQGARRQHDPLARFDHGVAALADGTDPPFESVVSSHQNAKF